MASPSGRVVAFAQLLRLGPIEHGFDTLANPAGGLGLDRPDRIQDFQDVLGLNLIDGQGADGRDA